MIRFARELSRTIARHRRLLAAALAAASVAIALQAAEPPAPPTITVLAAARDLSGGVPLRPDDLDSIDLPAQVVPSGAIRPGDDRADGVLAAPMRAGEPLTDARLVGPSLAAGYGTELVAAPVRIADGEAVRLLDVGDRVDVLAASTSPEELDQPVSTVARAAPVVVVPEPDAAMTVDGALVVLAVPADVAAELAHRQVAARLSVIVRATS